ncbi:MAG TPA: hypothetical protein PK280_05870 [Planctomycetota bacterium]|nr:hypothetical protein [Planctomycetota bacterium]
MFEKFAHPASRAKRTKCLSALVPQYLLAFCLALPSSAAEPPYELPKPGEVKAIGTNKAVDVAKVVGVKPDMMTTALFGAFGGGTFVRDYSSRGAYVFTCMGGHAAPMQLTGAVFFDFEDATWKAFENANGVATINGGTAFCAQNSNGDPWQEWKGTEVPLPSHPYLIAAELPAALGGGPKGSVVFIGRAGVQGDGGGGRGPHALNLDTRKWSRLTSADHPRMAGIYSSVLFDEKTGRYYSVGGIEKRKDLPYYDAADWSKVKATAPQYGWPAFGGGGWSFLDPVRRLIIDFAGKELHVFQLDNPGAGWKVLKVEGELPAVTSPEPCRFVFYPPDGNFYYRPVNGGGATLHRLKPPADEPLTKAWTADKVQLAAPMPDCAAAGGNGAWYSFFFYVPSIKCLGWMAGADKPVYICKPPEVAPADGKK